MYWGASDGTACRGLTDLNGEALSAVQVQAPTRLTRTSPEGWEVESWLWLPPSHRAGDAPLPAVLYFPGGPHNTVALGFQGQKHVLAGAGVSVRGVNFHGTPAFPATYPHYNLAHSHT